MLRFENQVGGHKDLTEEGGALVVPSPGFVAKPTGYGYWAGEDAFYETLSQRADPLLQWCPTYHGTRVLAGRTHVVMEDLTHGMRRPCVVDIKVGTCTVAPDAAWPKRVSHLLKDRQCDGQDGEHCEHRVDIRGVRERLWVVLERRRGEQAEEDGHLRNKRR